MRLRALRIESFKSIEDSTEFSVDQVTCLVGKNESGKTAILQALYKLNPDVDEAKNFDQVEEYPRRSLNDYEERLKQNTGVQPANVLTTHWDLDDDDVQAADLVYGKGVIASRQVTIIKGYQNQRFWPALQCNESAAIAHSLKDFNLPKPQSESLLKLSSISELIDALTAHAATEPRAALLAALKTKYPQSSLESAVRNFLAGRLPKFLYFDNYHRLPGKVALQDLVQREANNQIEFEDRVFRALLSQAGTTPEELQTIDRFEPFAAKLEGISNRITQQIFAYWTQNRNLEVQFRLDEARPGDATPFNQGQIFRTRVRNNRHGVTVDFDERSTGFVWFFSFLVWFSQVERTYGKNLFILLDEPGLSLHGRAQADLLRYFREQLAPKYQVMYTTHSPFMVDPELLTSSRTVEDVVKDGELLGTKVGDRVFSTDADTLFPLQAALGYDITQNLFVGTNCVLVEGPSDLLYIQWFSRLLRAQKRTYLDPRWTLTPVGGIDKVATFAALLGGTRLHIAVLLDYAQGQKGKVRSLQESELLRVGHVLTADTYAGQAEADIEDIIGRTTYSDLIRECYGLSKKNELPAARPPNASERVAVEVKAHFAALPPVVAEFDHLGPAIYLMEHSSELAAKLADLDKALDRFERLCSDLNSML